MDCSDNPFIQRAELALLRQRPGEAESLARMGLTLFPDLAELWEILATCASLGGNLREAESAWQRVADLAPENAEAFNNLGILLDRQQRYDEAAAAYRQALTLAPRDASVRTNYALLLENTGQLAEAEAQQRQALELNPRSAEIHSNLAGLLAKRNREAEAEQGYQAALALKPDFATAHSNLGVLLTDQKRFAEAEAHFRQALAIQPDYPAAESNLSQLLLVQGRLREGWPYFEARRTIHEIKRRRQSEGKTACPYWQGEPLAGRRILVLPEQGLGDEIQFARYLPWLKGLAPAQLTLVCRPAQLSLMRTLSGPDQVVSLHDAATLMDDYDYWTFLMSLPRHCATDLATIPAPIPYLAAEPGLVDHWAPCLGGPGRRIGIVWRGNHRHSNDADRSLPDLRLLAPLWSVPGCRFFSLQKLSTGEAPGPFPADQPMVDLGSRIDDLADTAAILSQLDLLITVDTSVCHLAGALGIPCWILLPAYKTDWRWLEDRQDSPWYPGKTRLFRQPARGDWPAPIQAMTEALQRLGQDNDLPA